jgi:hypothetical protein
MFAPRRKSFSASDTTLAAKQVAVLLARPFHRSLERILRLTAGFCFQFMWKKPENVRLLAVGYCLRWG